MYSINVFLTFTLSQLGMCKHWWEARKTESVWLRKLCINHQNGARQKQSHTIEKFCQSPPIRLGWVAVPLPGVSIKP